MFYYRNLHGYHQIFEQKSVDKKRVYTNIASSRYVYELAQYENQLAESSKEKFKKALKKSLDELVGRTHNIFSTLNNISSDRASAWLESQFILNMPPNQIPFRYFGEKPFPWFTQTIEACHAQDKDACYSLMDHPEIHNTKKYNPEFRKTLASFLADQEKIEIPDRLLSVKDIYSEGLDKFRKVINRRTLNEDSPLFVKVGKFFLQVFHNE